MNMKPNPLGHPMIGFATMMLDIADYEIDEIGKQVERAIDDAADSAKTRGVKLTNVQVTPVGVKGLLLVFTITRN